MSVTHPAPPLARRALLIGGALAALGAALVWSSLKRSAAQAPEAAAGVAPAADLHGVQVFDTPTALPAFQVMAPGGARDLSSLQGHWSVLFFGYTQCPDVCPGSLGMLATALKQLPAAARPSVLFISVDPARDTAELLAQYVPAFDPAFEGAAGSDASIAALVRSLGVVYERHAPSASGQYTVDHTASLFLVDPQARLKAVFTPPHDADAVASALRRLMA
ncbi:SCO family protein [Ideonella sp. 4Y11]|uniref:SCO family protein n=1 Tax=Ideonella aquatica TaxID=2824119 RepID=A0A940YPM0_9BURK|nr:SCO family protein [Ideonella aquatica]MBQ0960196.1 SCO family protein [Ideonella aquatica]